MAGRPRMGRLDAELVRRGLARSREQANQLIGAGRVNVAGLPALKPATRVAADTAIAVSEPHGPQYASRGGFKLAGALAAFPGLDVGGRVCLDCGASTGGFTDVLLRAGARCVIAVDVGYGQLAWDLRQDDRVTVVDRTNVRHLTPDRLAGHAPELLVADLSFISLTSVLPALVACASPEADYLLLVKPQFEVGKGRVGSGGVVREAELRAEAIITVARAAEGNGLGVVGVTASPLPGPSGNVEYFLWLRTGAGALDERVAHRAVAEGPEGAAQVGSS